MKELNTKRNLLFSVRTIWNSRNTWGYWVAGVLALLLIIVGATWLILRRGPFESDLQTQREIPQDTPFGFETKENVPIAEDPISKQEEIPLDSMNRSKTEDSELELISSFGGVTDMYEHIQDQEGNSYRILSLNDVDWMADNLNIEVPDSWCYEKDPENCKKYGRLYTWRAAKKACKLLGPGWRLPSDREWQTMTNLFGGANDDDKNDGTAAYKMMIDGGSSGFDARLGGYRDFGVRFNLIGRQGYYWSATEEDAIYSWNYYYRSLNGRLERDFNLKSAGLSCRCVQD